jgi:hypothetical protein
MIKIIFVEFVKIVQQNPSLIYERQWTPRLDDCNILQPGHLVRSRLSRPHDSISVQNLSISWLRILK